MPGAEATAGKKKKKNKSSQKWSFSASLPIDASAALMDRTVCVVVESMDPFSDFKESILQMVRHGEVHDWKEMEELVYCYIALNSTEVHKLIQDAFLSLACSFAHLY
ncbi:hypothetical protein Nepgr_030011 [Nepenthes gracilis]|uniref:Transcription repressor n=1 Tax=Nepenthes gracilis TaxID=150966 RepID=A0AAD3Y3S4_NEPGR|nr:hypothetical protein Nepgr_030011 [Nepenthes gracilis]